MVWGAVLAGSVSVASAGTISTFAGGGTPSGSATSIGQEPAAVAVGPGGELLIADTQSNTVHAVSPAGQETTFAGDGTNGFGGDGNSATTAELDYPDALAVDTHGDVLIADNGNNRVRMVAASTCTSGCAYGLPATAKGDIYTIVGTGTAGFSADGTAATAAELNGPSGLWVDAHGNVLVSDVSSVRVLAARTCTSGCAYGIPTTINDLYTIAGTGTPGYGGDSGTATAAQLQDPHGVTVDGDGNVLIADSGNDRVRLVAASDCSTDSCDTYNLSSTTPGDIYTIAGGSTGSFVDGTNAAAINLNDPTGVWVDGAGNVLIGDQGSYQKVALIAAENCSTAPCPYGLSSPVVVNRVYAIAGNGNAGYTGDGIAATSAELNGPSGVMVDGDGNVLLADSLNDRVRLLAETACSGGSCEYGLGSATAGDIYTVAGNGSPGSSGDAGPATAAGLTNPQGVAVDGGTGDVVIADTADESVRLIAGATCSSSCEFGLPSTVKGQIYTIAGTGTAGYSGNGGPGTQAELDQPSGVAFDSSGDVLVADTGNDTVRLIPAAGCPSAEGCDYGLMSSTAGHIYTIAGTGTPGFSGDDGPGTDADLNQPEGVATDGVDNVLIADSDNNRVRLVSAHGCAPCGYGIPAPATAGDIYTIAGDGTGGYNTDGVAPTASELDIPDGVAVNRATSDVVIADASNERVRLIAGAKCTSGCPYSQPTMRGDIYTIAGNGTPGYAGNGNSATSAELKSPQGVAVTGDGNVLIADTENDRVRLVSAAGCQGACPYGLPGTTAGDIYTIGGNGTAGYDGDGGKATDAELDMPTGVAYDADGDALIADSVNNRIRLVSSTITTLDAPTSAATNEAVTLTATVTAPTGFRAPAGTVSFNNEDTPIPGCAAEPLSAAAPYTATCGTSFSASSSPATLNAVYTPSDSTPGGSASDYSHVTIGKDATTTSVKASTTTPDSGQSVTYTATVTPNDPGSTRPTGTVEFIDQTGTITSCATQPLSDAASPTATCTLKVISGYTFAPGYYKNTGGHSITAQYSGDANFVGSTAPPPPVNTARPEITGEPDVGDTLTADQGTWINAPTKFAYQWLLCDEGSDCKNIAGATASTHVVTPQDDWDYEDVTVTVTVTATNANGSGVATSEQTDVIRTALTVTSGNPQTSGDTVSLPADCTDLVSANAYCVLQLLLVALESSSGPAPDVAAPASSHRGKQRFKSVVVGREKVTIKAGHKKLVRLTLNRTGQRLLAKHHKLKVTLEVKQAGHKTVKKTVVFKAKARTKHKGAGKHKHG
jgi:hypothetical protein